MYFLAFQRPIVKATNIKKTAKTVHARTLSDGLLFNEGPFLILQIYRFKILIWIEMKRQGKVTVFVWPSQPIIISFCKLTTWKQPPINYKSSTLKVMKVKIKRISFKFGDIFYWCGKTTNENKNDKCLAYRSSAEFITVYSICRADLRRLHDWTYTTSEKNQLLIVCEFSLVYFQFIDINPKMLFIYLHRINLLLCPTTFLFYWDEISNGLYIGLILAFYYLWKCRAGRESSFELTARKCCTLHNHLKKRPSNLSLELWISLTGMPTLFEMCPLFNILASFCSPIYLSGMNIYERVQAMYFTHTHIPHGNIVYR